jgi:hypothetical protein
MTPYNHGRRRHLLCTAAARHGLNWLNIETFMIVLVQFLEQITLVVVNVTVNQWRS